jgi:hypothetical protein
MTSLDERIASAFRDGMTSGDVADLIQQAETAAVACGEAAEVARSQALNPALCAADVAAARHQMEDAAFKRDRMREAVRRLGERLVEVKRQEEEARRLAAYNAALVERDKLAAELAEIYPSLAEKLADLGARVAANDAAIERVNQRQPDGAPWLTGAELIARELNSFSTAQPTFRGSPATCACPPSATPRSTPSVGRLPEDSDRAAEPVRVPHTAQR